MSSTDRTEKRMTRLIKRHANHKLYDTTERRITTQARIRTLVRNGIHVLVVDHDTGADRTLDTLR